MTVIAQNSRQTSFKVREPAPPSDVAPNPETVACKMEVFYHVNFTLFANILTMSPFCGILEGQQAG